MWLPKQSTCSEPTGAGVSSKGSWGQMPVRFILFFHFYSFKSQLFFFVYVFTQYHPWGHNMALHTQGCSANANANFQNDFILSLFLKVANYEVVI